MKNLRISTANFLEMICEAKNYEDTPLNISLNSDNPSTIDIPIYGGADKVLIQGRFVITGRSGDANRHSTITIDICKNTSGQAIETMEITACNGEMQIIDVFTLDTLSILPIGMAKTSSQFSEYSNFFNYIFKISSDLSSEINAYTLTFLRFS